MKLLVKTGITLVIFLIIFNSIDVDKFLYTLGKSNGLFLLFGLFFQYLSTALASYRWHLIMRILRYGLPFGFFYASYFKATFFNQALPSTIGGDAVRVLDLIAEKKNKKRAFFDVLIDRVIGLLGLLVLSLVANLLYPGVLPGNIHLLVLLLSAGGIAGVAVLLNLSRINLLKRFRFLKLFYDLSLRFRIILRNRRRVWIQILLSVAVHLLAVAAFYMIALSISMKVDFTLFAVIIPAVLLISIIPVSLAGWGVRESAMIGLFLLVGADREKVLSISVLYGIILILIGLYGAFYYWKEAKRNKPVTKDHP
jgi:hypothetical protein